LNSRSPRAGDASQSAVSEVNFWRPGGPRAFRALQLGEPLLFKTHAPSNRLVGGGLFSGFAALHVSEAWDLYGTANGVATAAEMRQRVGYYRRRALAAGEDPLIGCILVRDVSFLPLDQTADPPPGLRPSVVQGKSYETDAPATAHYFETLAARLYTPVAGGVWRWDGPMHGDPAVASHRLGQHAFQAVVLDTYQRQCAITGNRVRPVLQAAHIRSVEDGGQHRTDNGLLLRSDVHILYDRGYLAVDTDYRLRVSPRLLQDFGNGDEFYARAGQRIALPSKRIDRPGRDFLEYHLDNHFLS